MHRETGGNHDAVSGTELETMYNVHFLLSLKINTTANGHAVVADAVVFPEPTNISLAMAGKSSVQNEIHAVLWEQRPLIAAGLYSES